MGYSKYHNLIGLCAKNQGKNLFFTQSQSVGKVYNSQNLASFIIANKSNILYSANL